eukprot:COSAG02_NODE_21240_length_796_cov_99.717360_1_plen_100_part_00
MALTLPWLRHEWMQATQRRRRRLPALKYRLAEDAAWGVVDQYELNLDTPGQSNHAIASHFQSTSVQMSHTFVQRDDDLLAWAETYLCRILCAAFLAQFF